MRQCSLAVQRVVAGKPREELQELNNLISTYYDSAIKPALAAMTPDDRQKFYNDVFKAIIAKQQTLKAGLDNFEVSDCGNHGYLVSD